MADIVSTIDEMTLNELRDIKVAAVTPALPSLTETKIKAIISKLRNVGAFNGYYGIAELEGVYAEHVKIIDKERVKKIQALLKEKTVEVM